MHECPECYTMCDCDGDDLDQPAPANHVCINEQCGWDGDDFSPFDGAPLAAPEVPEGKEGGA